MRRIRQVVRCVVLASTFSASVPCLAESGSTTPASEPERTAIVNSASKLDLSRFPAVTDLSAQGLASPEAPLPMKVQMQTSGGGSSGLSTAKKTWIIVGSVVGAALIVAAVSNSGGGGGGGY